MEIIKLEPAFVDDRGSIWDLLSDNTIHHSGYLISKKNSIRGKHYHKEQKQYTLLLKGLMELSIKNLKDPKSPLEVFQLHPFEMVLIPPFHYHSLNALEDCECVIFTSKSRTNMSYEEDTFRVENINSFSIL
ncbi:MAG: WxcM-like domain-containing protein [Nanoarchaeota archaeon]